ncbi:MAG: hypothetical protein FWB93_01465 [Oscillospiraceae bacterium]|nr:hypothetical protein [Oscillospiraceae bacterium]
MNIDTIFPLIDAMLVEGGGLVCLDGRSCAGKTTIAAQLAEHYGCGVVHMDDFFLPAEKRTPECNIDFPRFRQQVTEQLHLSEFSYDAYCCKNGKYTAKTVQTSPFLLIEGCYCLHPDTELNPNLRLFADISSELQRERLLMRNGEDGYKKFCEMWLPREEAYFRAHRFSFNNS